MNNNNNNNNKKLKTNHSLSSSSSLNNQNNQNNNMLNKKIDVNIIAKPFIDDLKIKCNELKNNNIIPKLIGFLANNDKFAKKYAEWTMKSCKQVGIDFELRECKQLELQEKLKEANEDKNVHGIMIYYPCFGSQPSFSGQSMDDFLRDSIAVEKDVEGLCSTYRRNLYSNTRYLLNLDGSISDKKCILPCTPLSVIKILEGLNVYDENLKIGERMKNKIVTVINRSEIVGRPVAAMLANDGADVYSIDIDSIYLMQRGKIFPTHSNFSIKEAITKSDVIICGVPSKEYKLNTSWVKEGAVVLNVSSYKNVHEDELLKIKDIKYVPLVGKVTVAMLERNLLRLIHNFHLSDDIKVIEAGGRIIDKNKI